MGFKKYDLIFFNFVFYWILDKDKVFRNMFDSLKVGGKIVIYYIDVLFFFIIILFEVLNLEIVEKFNKMFCFDIRDNIDCMCCVVGFDVVSSYYVYDKMVVYFSVENFL